MSRNVYLSQIDPLSFGGEHRYDISGKVFCLSGLRHASLKCIFRIERHLAFDHGAIILHHYFRVGHFHAKLEFCNRVEAFA